MDQAASVMSSPASALYISFFPKLAAVPVKLPPGASFVIMHSRVIADKLVSSKTGYNLRVVETLAAARALAKKLGVSIDSGGRLSLNSRHLKE
jgi:galactokinase